MMKKTYSTVVLLLLLVKAPYAQVQIKDIFNGQSSSLGLLSDNQFVAYNNKVYFAATDSTTKGLWETNGIGFGTRLIKSFVDVPKNLTVAGNLLFFQADDGIHGKELWKTDGTINGTEMVKDLIPGVDGSDPSDLVSFNNKLYFFTKDGPNDHNLWESDGTANGTDDVKAINPGPDGALGELTLVNGTLYFSFAYKPSNDGEIWKSDGTSGGTTPVKSDFVDLPSGFIEAGGIIYFRGRGKAGNKGIELWKTDGTAAGTQLVKDINQGSNDGLIKELIEYKNELFFSANNGTDGQELWKSNGTAAGTFMVLDINPSQVGNKNGDPASIVELDGALYFSATNGTSGIELWKSTGTPSKTIMIKNINVSGSSMTGMPNDIIVIDSLMYFQADDGSTGNELWKSDGTFSGTVLVGELNPSVGANTSIGALTNINGTLYFKGDNGIDGSEPWRYYPYESNATLSICNGDSVLIGNSWQSVAGEYWQVVAGAAPNGQDSLILTELLLNPSYAIITYDTICAGDSIRINGVYRTQAGAYTDSLTTHQGCDSVRTAFLHVKPLPVAFQALSTCFGDSIMINGTYRYSAGTYIDTIDASSGCDSVIITQLSIDPLPLSSRQITICKGDSIMLGGQYRKDAGTYNDTIPYVNVCDTVFATELFVFDFPLEISSDGITCQGKVTTLNGFNPELVSYRWSFSDDFNNLISADSSFQFVFNGIDSTLNIYLEATHTNGCKFIDSVQLEDLTIPLGPNHFDFTLAIDTNIEKRYRVHLQIDPTPVPEVIDSLYWDFGDGYLFPLNPDTTSYKHVYQSRGTYAICLVGFNECDTQSVCKNVTIDMGVGIKKLLLEQVKVYPIPTNNLLMIDLPSNLADVELTLTNTIGQILLKQPINKQENQVSVATLPEGLYHIRLKSDQYSRTILLPILHK